MNDTDLRAIVVQLLTEEGGADPADLDDDLDLLEEEILDSLGVFAVVSAVEERFGVEIPPEQITPENFSSIERLCALVGTYARS